MSHSVADCQDVLIGEREVIRKIGCGLDKRRKEERKEEIRRERTDNRLNTATTATTVYLIFDTEGTVLLRPQIAKASRGGRR